jgi:hypothetical protein
MRTNFVNPAPESKVAAQLYQTLTAGASGAEDVKLSAAITNDGFNYLDIILAGRATIGSEKTVDIDITIWECATTNGTYTKFKDFETVLELDDEDDGDAYNARVTGFIQGAKAFLKVGIETDFSATSVDTNTYHALAYKTKLVDVG